MVPKRIVKTSTLVLACILLFGIISMAFGFYNNDSLFIKAGISITLLTSLIITFQNVLSLNKKRKINNFKFLFLTLDRNILIIK